MLRALRSGIVFATLLALFAFILARPLHFDIVLPHNTDVEPFLADEGAVRSERSANISHIIGVSRKIQLIVNKIMYLQISPDGSVNGTDNDNDYTVLQRASLNNYQIKIQGVVTCNFLCMDRCGLLYGSKEFTDDCIFNEMMESHHFNTYSSAKYSNDKRTLYLALNKKGIPRKVQTKAKASLGKLEAYTNVLTKPVAADRVEGLALKIAKARALLGKFLQGSGEEGTHLFRHHRYQFCPNVPMTKVEDKSSKFRCRKKEKRKKKRKCRDDEDEDDDCTPVSASAVVATTPLSTTSAASIHKKKTLDKCEEDEDEEECQRRLHGVRQKRKLRTGGDTEIVLKCSGGKCMDDKEKKRKKRLKMEKKKLVMSASTTSMTMTVGEKTLNPKCDSEINCGKKGPKGNAKGPSKKDKSKPQATSVSGEEPSTGSQPWRDALGDAASHAGKLWSSTWVELATEKLADDYEDEDQPEAEKLSVIAPDEDEELPSAETEWPPLSSSISLNRD